MRILSALGKLLNRDLTGRTWQQEVSHPYFQRLIYFGSKKAIDCYWEAELPLPGSPEERIGVNMTGTAQGPTEEEVGFCKRTLENLDALFDLCRPAFEGQFQTWAKQPMPVNWRDSFRLDGFQVPIAGDISNSWEVCYFVEPAGHYFTAVFENGQIIDVAVDG